MTASMTASDLIITSVRKSIAAVSIRVEVTTQVDYVILYSKVQLFVQIKLPG